MQVNAAYYALAEQFEKFKLIFLQVASRLYKLKLIPNLEVTKKP
jgi:hypothetical protein